MTSRSIIATAVLVLAAVAGAWAGLIILARESPVFPNFIAREEETQRLTNGTIQYRGAYVDDGDFLLLEELPNADYSNGGVYFIGSSETRTTIKPWELAAEERALIHNFSVPDVRHREVLHFLRMLVEEQDLLSAGPDKTCVILTTYYFMARVKDPEERPWEDYVEKLFERHGFYEYDWEDGIHKKEMSSIEANLRIWREEAHRFLQTLTGREIIVSAGAGNDDAVRKHIEREFPPNWRAIMDEELDYFAQTLDYLEKLNVRYVILRPPLAPVHDEFPYRAAYEEGVSRILEGRNARIADFRNAFPGQPIEKNEYISDHVHLRYKGQALLHEAYRSLALEQLREMGNAPGN